MSDRGCDATMVSTAVQNHTHTCSGHDEIGDHFCPICKRWWWERPKEEAR